MDSLEIRKMNEQFIKSIRGNDPDYFEKLKQGQTPEFFVVACSDSRVCPSVIMQMPLGKMFIHRNIANQVNVDDESFTASLYYALVHLKVEKIIIEGHTDCGGVKAAWNEVGDVELAGWLNKIKAGLPEKNEQCTLTLDELAKENLLKQVENVKNHPVYIRHGLNVEVLAALFHVESGELEWVPVTGD